MTFETAFSYTVIIIRDIIAHEQVAQVACKRQILLLVIRKNCVPKCNVSVSVSKLYTRIDMVGQLDL